MKFIGFTFLIGALLIAAGSFGINFVIVIGAVVGAASSLAFSFKMLQANKTELRKNQRRSRSLKSTLLGRAKTRDDWMPDARVQGGMVFNKRRKRIEITGQLSNDSLDRAFK
jgi:hypothetical protein